jgi:hypothetical protein
MIIARGAERVAEAIRWNSEAAAAEETLRNTVLDVKSTVTST